MNNQTQPRYLTPRQLADRWGIPADRVGQWRRQGRIRGLRLTGKTWRYPLAEVERFEREAGAGLMAELAAAEAVVEAGAYLPDVDPYHTTGGEAVGL